MSTLRHESLHRLLSKLSSEEIKKNLIKASLFITAFELLKNDIVRKVKDFYICGFDSSGFKYSPDYKAKVRSKDKDIFKASCMWLFEGGALKPEHLDDLLLIREHRNEIVHELPKFLIDSESSINEELLKNANDYLKNIGKFWGSIEVDINPDFDNVEVDYDGIESLTSVLMSYIIEVCQEN